MKDRRRRRAPWSSPPSCERADRRSSGWPCLPGRAAGFGPARLCLEQWLPASRPALHARFRCWLPRRSAAARCRTGRRSRRGRRSPFPGRPVHNRPQAQDRQRQADLVVQVARASSVCDSARLSTCATTSLVVDLPTLPVMPITRRSSFRRQKRAICCRAVSVFSTRRQRGGVKSGVDPGCRPFAQVERSESRAYCPAG